MLDPCGGISTVYSLGSVPEIVRAFVSYAGSTFGHTSYSILKRTSISTPDVAAVNVTLPPLGNDKGYMYSLLLANPAQL